MTKNPEDGCYHQFGICNDPTGRHNDDLLKLELLRITDALGLERTERLLRSIRRSTTSGQELSWSGQTLATQVLREWINTSHVEYLTPNEAWDKTGEILRAYLTGGR